MKEPDLIKEALEAWKRQVQKTQPIRRVKLNTPRPGLPQEHLTETQGIRGGHETAITDLYAHLSSFARLIDETYKADPNRIKAIEKRIGIDLAPYRADLGKTIRDEDLARLRAFVENPERIDELTKILFEIEAAK